MVKKETFWIIITLIIAVTLIACCFIIREPFMPQEIILQ